MDVGVFLESPQGSQSSSRVGECTCTFLPCCSSSVTLPFSKIRESGAFPRGFPTGLSHVPPWCESILGLKVEQCRENRLPWNGLRHLGDSGNGGRTLGFLSPMLWRAPPLEMRWERRNSFPTTQGKDPSSRARRRKRGSSGCGQNSTASSRVETGMSGNFLSCSKGVKDPLEVPVIRCD